MAMEIAGIRFRPRTTGTALMAITRKLKRAKVGAVNGKVTVGNFFISVDGFGAGLRQDLEHPLGVRGLELHDWFFKTEVFNRIHGREGGVQGIDNKAAAESFKDVGAWILSRNMFGPVRGPGRTNSGEAGGVIALLFALQSLF